jgi:hypothetical protein
LKQLAIKLLALASFLGGPLYLSDLLKPEWGQQLAFVIAFAPVALVTFGALSLSDAPSERFSRIVVSAGLVGAALVEIEHAFAGWQLWIAGAVHPNRALISFGIAVGLPTAAFYARFARRFLEVSAPSGPPAEPPPLP